MFITIEGIEGSGKSTNAAFVIDYLNKLGKQAIHTREPGGTVIAEKIRTIFLDKSLDESITNQAELLLLFAARSQHLEHLIIPALRSNKYVVCERFTDASFAYQGGGRCIDMQYIVLLEKFVQQGISPDVVLLFDVNVAVALDRINKRGNIDRIEKEKADFFERVRDVYLKRAALDSKKYYIIDANCDLMSVQQQIIDILLKIIK